MTTDAVKPKDTTATLGLYLTWTAVWHITYDCQQGVIQTFSDTFKFSLV